MSDTIMSPPPAKHVPIYRLPPISRQEAEACRHKSEKRWYGFLVTLNILLIVGVTAIVVIRFAAYKQWFDSQFVSALSFSTSQSYYERLAEELPYELRLFLSGITSLIVLIPSLYYFYATERVDAVKITRQNFPEVYAMIESYAHRLGMEKVPEAYIKQRSGVLNAFSAFLFGRQYLVFNAEIFEVAYREHHDMEALGFIAAHEMAHIYYRHATLSYNLWILFSQMIPILGQTASRTREYSCDRLAQHLTQYDGIEAMLMLMVDRHLYKMIDKVDYLQQARETRGFFIFICNLLSTHPIMPKRIRALAMKQGSGELY